MSIKINKFGAFITPILIFAFGILAIRDFYVFDVTFIVLDIATITISICLWRKCIYELGEKQDVINPTEM